MNFDKEYYSQEEAIYIMCIERMKDNIKKLGNKKVWETIEGLSNYLTRLSYRNLFIRANGIIPESEI